ncbi:MAG: TRAP transporter small permease subunit [Alphaproteobacteria bacterium]|nr:TRAP transporter small permease subunit [Alphaproteobacteria bacterium]
MKSLDPLFRSYCNFVDRLNKSIAKIASWLTLVIIIVIMIDVIMRYAFNTGYVVIQELQWHLFALIVMLGSGYTLLKNEHIRVDIFYQRFTPKKQAWVNLVGTIFLLFPTCLLIIYASWPFVLNSYEFFEGSPNPGGIPLRFLLKAMIPFGFFLVLLQGSCTAIRSLYFILDIDLGEKK